MSFYGKKYIKSTFLFLLENCEANLDYILTKVQNNRHTYVFLSWSNFKRGATPKTKTLNENSYKIKPIQLTTFYPSGILALPQNKQWFT